MQYAMPAIRICSISNMGCLQMLGTSSNIWNCPPRQDKLCGWPPICPTDGRGSSWTIFSTHKSCSLPCTFAKRWGMVLHVSTNEESLLQSSRRRRRTLPALSKSGGQQRPECFTTQTIPPSSLQFWCTTQSLCIFFPQRQIVLSGY